MTGPAYRYRATISRWVDGDTFDARVDLGFTVHVEQRFRLAGLDTPERGRPGATEARDYCAAQGAEVTIESVRPDKYGRYLARVHLADGRVLNDDLLARGLARAYDGGAR